MENEYGLVGGNIFHGELSREQLFHMRPAPGYANYRTPIKGLYYGSSATHGGGGVCGIPGWQAAKAAIADRRIEQAGSRAARLLGRAGERPGDQRSRRRRARRSAIDARGTHGRSRRRQRTGGKLRLAHDERGRPQPGPGRDVPGEPSL